MQFTVRSWIVHVLHVFRSRWNYWEFYHFWGMTPRRFKCIQFCKGTMDFSLECIQLLQNDFFKQQYITFNATVLGQDRIYQNTHLCKTSFAGYMWKIAWMSSSGKNLQQMTQVIEDVCLYEKLDFRVCPCHGPLCMYMTIILNISNKNPNLYPLRAVIIMMRKKMGHTAVWDDKPSSMTL